MTSLSSDQSWYFTATQVPKYTISGQVTFGGVGLDGVMMTLRWSGSQSTMTRTSGGGYYQFSSLPAGVDYTVTPSLTSYTFTPASRSFSALSSDQSGVNFTASGGAYYTISGQVTGGGIGLNGVTMTLSGSQSGTQTTSGGGYYSFSGLQAGGGYTVKPSLSGYTFTPVDRSFSFLSSDWPGVNFTASGGYTISGRVTSGGTGLDGVTMALSGSQSGSTTTSGGGYYSFSCLPGGASYTITPSKGGYTFVSSSRSYLNLDRSYADADFVANPIGTYSITGRVTESSGGAGLDGVTMTLSGWQSGTTTTSGGGYYSFSGLPAGHPYTVAPSKSGYTFSPTSAGVASLGSNQS